MSKKKEEDITTQNAPIPYVNDKTFWSNMKGISNGTYLKLTNTTLKFTNILSANL